jgi:hypothetical protein
MTSGPPSTFAELDALVFRGLRKSALKTNVELRALCVT